MMINRNNLMHSSLESSSSEKHVERPQSSSGIVLANGIHLYYKIHGLENSQLLVLIGGLSRDHNIWNNLIPNLASKFKVLTFDNRGTGQSEYKAPYNAEILADDLASLLDVLELRDPAVIVGHSMGGFVAQYLAAQYPQKVKKLMLFNTCIKQPPAGVDYLTSRLQKLDIGASDEEMLRSALPWIFGSKFLSEEKIQQMITIARQNPYPQSRLSLRKQVELCINHNSSHIVDKINAQTLIITGEEDVVMTRDVCYELSTRIKKSSVTVLPGVAHMLQAECPELMSEQIINFATSTDKPRNILKSHL